MHRAALSFLVSVLVSASVVVAGCAQEADDLHGTPLDEPAGGSVDASVVDGGCVDTPPPGMNDPSKLPSCCTEGAAHCVPGQYVPGPTKQALASCNGGGYCVPDPFIKNPGFMPPACKAFNGTDGVCLSLCVPQVDQYKSVLTQSTCATDERCAPCVNPLTQQPSGACDLGKVSRTPCADSGGGGGPPHEGDAGSQATCPHQGPPVIDPNTLPACYSGGGAHCLQASLVPPQMASKLSSCAAANNAPGLCVPDVFIAAGGNFIPPTCASLEGAEGRCLHMALPDVAAQASQLPQSTCQSYERCVPCYSPMDGTDTSACHLSCDPGPTKPPVLFKGCCNENNTDEGKCIPPSLIPQSEQKNLKTDVCAGQDLCVPSEMLKKPFQPQTCTGSNFLTGDYSGVCLSDCLKFGIQGLFLDQGSCDDIHKCAPCTNPLTGQPTGAPGCP